MEGDLQAAVAREQLLARRAQLAEAMRAVASPEPLAQLLHQVDAALERTAAGTYGLCEVCRDAIEPDRLRADPLVRHCLDHLTPAEQRALEQDLDLTARIQSELLPQRAITFAGWKTFYAYQPLRAAGGDYCDLLTRDTGELFFMLGDVSGKGVAMSMLMAQLRAILRSLISLHLPFRELIARANRIFCESIGSERYATLVIGSAGSSGHVELCVAGHCPPLWLRHGTARRLLPTGLPFGLFCDSPYEVLQVHLTRGETLLMYTDGFSETTDASGLEYGEERLASAAAAGQLLPPDQLVENCLLNLAAFRGHADRLDDLTVLALQRTE